jgi:hypothetical protein
MAKKCDILHMVRSRTRSLQRQKSSIFIQTFTGTRAPERAGTVCMQVPTQFAFENEAAYSSAVFK